MRRIAILIALMAVLVAVAAGSAFALRGGSIIHCTKIPCYGSGTYDHIFERTGNRKADKIIMRGGDDLVTANHWTNDKDIIRGGPGNDAIHVNDGDTLDKATGGKGGSDKCIVDSRSEAGRGCGIVRVR